MIQSVKFNVARTREDYSGPIYLIDGSSNGPRPGDLAVHRAGYGTPVLLQEGDLGLALSSSFIVLRFSSYELALAAWAALTVDESKRRKTDMPALRKSDFSRYFFKLLTETQQQAVGKLLPKTVLFHRQDNELTATWWRIEQLTSSDWRVPLTTPNPSIWKTNVPLSNLGTIVIGQFSRKLLDTGDEPCEHDIRAVTAGELRSGNSEAHMVSCKYFRDGEILNPGDIMFLPSTNELAAEIVKEPVVLARGLVGIKPSDSAESTALRNYLASSEFSQHWAQLSAGLFFGATSAATVSRIPVPNDYAQRFQQSERQLPINMITALRRILHD